MTIEEKLAHAIENYPIGTVFISPYSNNQFTVNKTPTIRGRTNISTEDKSASPWIYYDGKWALIVSSPINAYELW
jgi:hypothetical protein